MKNFSSSLNTSAGDSLHLRLVSDDFNTSYIQFRSILKKAIKCDKGVEDVVNPISLLNAALYEINQSFTNTRKTKLTIDSGKTIPQNILGIDNVPGSRSLAEDSKQKFYDAILYNAILTINGKNSPEDFVDFVKNTIAKISESKKLTSSIADSLIKDVKNHEIVQGVQVVNSFAKSSELVSISLDSRQRA